MSQPDLARAWRFRGTAEARVRVRVIMEYMPQVTSMNRLGGCPLGDKHTVLLFDQIESEGLIRYTFILGVFDNETQAPVYFVTSEVNSMAEELEGGSHFLCVFDGAGHANMGDSDDWANPKKFFPKALQIAAERFGVELDPSLLNPPPQDN